MVSAWWNASVESQAMDRVHRIGQTKPVRVVRMVSADSIEDRILEMQEAKEALGSGALRKVIKEGGRKREGCVEGQDCLLIGGCCWQHRCSRRTFALRPIVARGRPIRKDGNNTE